MPQDKNKKLSYRFSKHSLYVGLAILMLLLIGGVAAKYIHQNSGRNIFAAKEFYFTSNFLTENGAEYVLNATATEVSFTLGNNADELRFSDDDVKYEVTVDNEAEVTSATGTLGNGKVSTETITLSKLEKGKTYNVTATGRAGYEKTLSASFTVSGDDENIYKYLDTSNDAYVLLTVWTENITGKVSVSFPAGLIPDNTDAALENVYNYENGSYVADSFTDNESFNQTYSSRSYRFFIDDAKDISANYFEVRINENHVAEIAIPK